MAKKRNRTDQSSAGPNGGDFCLGYLLTMVVLSYQSNANGEGGGVVINRSNPCQLFGGFEHIIDFKKI